MKKSLTLLLLVFTALSVNAASKNLSLIIPKASILNDNDEAEIKAYAKGLGQDITDNWFPREYNGKLRTAIKVSFSDTGETNRYINESSGNSSFDDSALAAIDRSLDSNFIYKDLDLEYVFDYRNTKRNFTMPFSQLFNVPAKIGAGYAAKKLGVNQLVLIRI